MAEKVQQDLELMLTELEQMQRVGLLSAEETKMVIKKRKRFEYKLQKQTKIKEDILAYIQYECSLLDLIELRRDKIGYLHKKNEIDDAIAKRINKLFKITEHRFGQVDDKIWITHLGKKIAISELSLNSYFKGLIFLLSKSRNFRHLFDNVEILRCFNSIFSVMF